MFFGVSIASSVRVMEQTSTFSSDGNTLYVGGSGEGNYTKIQDAINNASDGDTVFVYNGTYYECLIVNKSINLIGENRDTTVIDANEIGNGINITSDGVKVSGFTIRNSKEWKEGIAVIQSSYAIISNNIINNCSSGIVLGTSSNNTIINNIIATNYKGMGILRASGNIITDNQIVENDFSGITLFKSCNNTIAGNNISMHTRFGIWFWTDNNDNIVSGNIFFHNPWSGVILSGTGNIISENFFSHNGYGISGSGIYDSTICNNDISKNRRGLLIGYCENNMIYKNNIKSNIKGIHLLRVSFNNKISSNNFINNVRNAIDDGGKDNIWENNYWGRARIFPKPILGWKEYRFNEYQGTIYPWIYWDWHPAQEPYDIGG